MAVGKQSGPSSEPSTSAEPGGATATPGKQTLTGSLPRPASGGVPLPPELRTVFERSLGADLSTVRIHTSSPVASEMNARAFTQGQDIHFAPGQYDPSSATGKQLLGHEVAHTVQQRSGPLPRLDLKPTISSPGEPLEGRADDAASAMVKGDAAPAVGSVSEPTIQREATGAAPAAPPAEVTPADKRLVTSFVAEFGESLMSDKVFPDVYPVTLKTGTPEEHDERIAKAATSLKLLFQAQQRKELLEFIATRLIPDDLFTGSIPLGTANVPQRTLISAHILAKGVTGTEKEGDAQTATGKGKFRALNCGHWAQSVWIYAGVASAAGDPGANAGSTLGTTGPTGKTTFPGAKPGQAIGPHSDKLTKKGEADKDDMTAMCNAPSGRLDALGAPDPATMFGFLKKLQPGDWIWIDNGKVAGHSLIFVDWVQEPAPGATSKGVAKCFSQLSNGPTAEGRKKDGHEDGGGELHNQTLGYPFGGGVSTITMIRRPDKDAAPPKDAASLLQFDRAKAAKDNALQIKKYSVVLVQYHRQMVTAVSAKLGASEKYDDATRTLCATVQTEASGSPTIENLSTLIALVQRMSSTGAGRKISGILDLGSKNDIALVPGGLPSLKAGAVSDLPWD